MESKILKALTDHLIRTQFLLDERLEIMQASLDGREGYCGAMVAEYDRVEGIEQGLLEAIALVKKIAGQEVLCGK